MLILANDAVSADLRCFSADFLEPGHLQFLAELHAEAFGDAGAWNAEAFATLLRSPTVAYVAWQRAGFCLFRAVAAEGEILTLAVMPSARRKGIGRTLLMSSLCHMASRGVDQVFLEVSETNVAARLLYLSAGFSVIAERQQYYADGSSALVMRRDLGSGFSGGG